MATGIQAYNALRHATSDLSAGKEFSVHTLDAYDLCKLTAGDLCDLKFDKKIAEQVSSALSNGDLSSLGQAIGQRLVVSKDASRLSASAP